MAITTNNSISVKADLRLPVMAASWRNKTKIQDLRIWFPPGRTLGGAMGRKSLSFNFSRSGVLV
jgi:hypothetical protein